MIRVNIYLSIQLPVIVLARSILNRPRGYPASTMTDRGGTHERSIDKSFEEFSEALRTADRRAREEVQQRHRMQQRLAQEEKEANEEHLRLLAQKARGEREVARQAGTAELRDIRSPSRSSSIEPASFSHDQDKSNSATHFFDLPQEVRDMVYAYFPYLASIHINQDPSIVVQPALSQACRRMRKESLDVFYGKNNFFLDLRGWKSSSYPRKWTPRMIFENWVTAIGNDNAARLRNLSFFSHNFRVNVRVSNERPPTLLLKFRTNLTKAEVAEGVPSSYTFAIAARRAESGLQRLLEGMQANTSKRGLSVENIKTICWAVDMIQPFLCRRINLGYQGAVLLEDDVPIYQWPRISAHLDKCDDCGYHRYTRGTDSSD